MPQIPQAPSFADGGYDALSPQDVMSGGHYRSDSGPMRSYSTIPVGAEGSRGLWGVAANILGPGASNAEISALTNQLIAVNPGVTNSNMRQGQELYLPTADTPTDSARAQALWQQYQTRQNAGAVRLASIPGRMPELGRKGEEASEPTVDELLDTLAKEAEEDN
jgi:hypothetical protein